MKQHYVPQVLLPNYSTVLLFRCTLKQYADEFIRGDIFFSFPKKWVEIEKSGKCGQGDVLEGTFASVNPLVNPALYKRLKNTKNTTSFTDGGYTFFRKNSILEIPCLCLYGLNTSSFKQIDKGNGQKQRTAIIPKEYFQDFTDCKNKMDYAKLDESKKGVVILINNVSEFFSRIKKALTKLGVEEQDIIIEPVNYINKYAEGMFLGKFPRELLIKDSKFKSQSEIRIVIKSNSKALKNVLKRNNHHIAVGSLKDITEIYDYYFDDMEIKRHGNKSLMISLPSSKEMDIASFSFIELYNLLCNIIVHQTVQIVGLSDELKEKDLNTQLKLIIDLFENKYNVLVQLGDNSITLQNLSEDLQKQLDEYHKKDILIKEKESEFTDIFNTEGPRKLISKCSSFYNDEIIGRVSHYYAGLAYKRLGEFENAIEHFSVAYYLDYKPIETLNEISVVLFGNEQYEDAIRIYKMIQDIKGYGYDILGNIGICYIHLNQLDNAITTFNQAIELNPLDSFLHYNLGVAYFKKGMIAESYFFLQKAMTIDPENYFYKQEFDKTFRNESK